MKLHSKLYLTFIYAFIPRFYSIACLSKLHSIITSLATTLDHRNMNSIYTIEGATLFTMQQPKNSRKRKTSYKEIFPANTGRKFPTLKTWFSHACQ